MTISNFLSECITPSDCPAGGTNYVCNTNKCDCPTPKVLDGDRCVGMLPFWKEKLPKHKMYFWLCTADAIWIKITTFFSECITHLDCPAGGTNYVCDANNCECPSPMVLDYTKCVGKLPLKKEEFKCIYCIELIYCMNVWNQWFSFQNA